MSRALLDAVRAASKPGPWTQGVKLAAAEGCVAFEKRDGTEHTFRVKPKERPTGFTVHLVPDDSWECSCDSPVDPCAHAVAAAIVLERDGAAASRVEDLWARVSYAFTSVGAGFEVRRELVYPDGRTQLLEGSLASRVGQGSTAELHLEAGELNADAVLMKPRRGPLSPTAFASLLVHLRHARLVQVDGLPVTLAPEQLLPLATVADEGASVQVRVEAPPGLTRVLCEGVALVGEVVCALGATDFCGARWEALPSVRTYEARELGELSTRVLPELSRRARLRVRTTRVPRIDTALTPRVELSLTTVPGALEVLPRLVYGNPPSARIDAGNLVYLGGAMPLRDLGREAELTRELRQELALVPGRRTRFEGAEVDSFRTRLRSAPGLLNGHLGGAARELVGEARTLHAHLDLAATTDAGGRPHTQALLTFRPQEGGPPLDAAAVWEAYRAGLGVLAMPGGGFAEVPVAWLTAHEEVLARLFAARDEQGEVANHALPALAALAQSLDEALPMDLRKLAPLVEGYAGLPEAEVPASLAGALRGYQREGVSWLSFLRQAGLGGILADEMGLGKTRQALAALSGKSLVVCPASLIPVWRAEAAALRPDLELNVYHGPRRVLSDASLTLTTYALLRLDAERLTEREWEWVVLDEAQAIKNPMSQAAAAAFRLRASARIALTGTPLENRLEELWSLMHFANKGLLGTRSSFQNDFSAPIESGSAQALGTLRRRIAPFILRRLKRDVASELPPRTESVRYVELSSEERQVYDALLNSSRSLVVEEGSTLAVLEAILRLRQAACHRGLVPGQAAASSSKVESLVESLTELSESGHRALVFSQWTSFLDKVEPHLTARGLDYLRLDGSTVDRGAVVEKFQAESGPPVMLISLHAGGAGLTLHAADNVFLCDPWWNPAVEEQAAARVHRIGQERPVFVYRLVALGTLEERILALQEKKRALFEQALEGGDAAARLTRDDLLELLMPP